MMLSRILLIAFISAESMLAHAMQQQPNATGSFTDKITQINENFYVGKIPNRFVWLVMERVTPSNIEGWKKYAEVQENNNTVDAISKKTNNTVKTHDGSGHFKMVLNEVDIHKNEVWIAYATTSPKPSPNDKKFNDYPSFIPYPKWFENPRSGTEADNIKMFVTVVSSPHAKITSHMGISVSAEGIFIGEREKNLSMHLHAFGAKVMLMRNPEREFMVNAPTVVMGQIIINALPQGTAFIGTRVLTLEEFKERNPVLLWKLDQTYGEIERRAKEAEDLFNKLKSEHKGDYKAAIKAMEVSMDRLIMRPSLLELPRSLQDYLTFNDEAQKVNPNVQPLKDKVYQEEFLKSFEDAKMKSVKDNPYIKGTNQVKGINEEAAKKFLDEYPPIISVNSADTSAPLEYMTIYDPKTNTVWLDISKNKDNENYNWLFTKPFAASGYTIFMAVNLQALANCQPLE